MDDTFRRFFITHKLILSRVVSYNEGVKKLFSFVRSYPIVAMVVVVIVAGLFLQFSGRAESARWLLSGFSIVVAVHLAWGMVQTLREGRWGIDILAVTAIVSTVIVGEYWATIVIVLMLTGGEALEDYAAARAQRELNALLERAPQTAHKIVGNETKTIKLTQVKVGDLLLVKPGEVVPVDAKLEDKVAEFDESSLTGESLPVEHKRGEELLSGSINGGKAITIKATKTAKDSQYQQIIELVKAAASTEAPFVRLADRYAVPFTIVSFIIAGTAWAISGQALRFAEVLVVATPCPLLLGAPIALISGMSRAAKNGVIIKSGGILERLATIKTVAFDKTGTLTVGEPVVASIKPQKGFSANEVLKLASSAEQQSSHILAHALVTESQRKKLSLSKPSKLEEVTAQGVKATINKHSVLVGKQSFLEKSGVSFKNYKSKAGETAVYLAVDKKFAGVIFFRDQLRPESKQVIKNLATVGVSQTVMLTGDTKATASRIAKEVGIKDFRAECLPKDKVDVVRDLGNRPVMMVGDGVNDAPVLAVADVGMAMGARGSTAASETADVVVLVDDLSKVFKAIEIAKNTIKIALQSIWVGIAISVGLMLVASTGAIPAVVGAALQEVVDVVVIINALRAHGPWDIAKG